MHPDWPLNHSAEQDVADIFSFSCLQIQDIQEEIKYRTEQNINLLSSNQVKKLQDVLYVLNECIDDIVSVSEELRKPKLYVIK